ncbi:integrative and conjugative element protein (TIGR02256 family) [Catenulispora sp. EB89]|uniref:Mov34/MPN/PAD-1 family protein n=1 Tax=Catenulispora sp. EB89 TaxID=3156257 RepID=UPI0035182600
MIRRKLFPGSPTTAGRRTTPAVTVTDTAFTAITRCAASSADGRETGGILLGHHRAHPQPVLDVVHAPGPGPQAVRRADFFRRDVRYAQAMADLAYRTDASIWIGDWHSHPGGPSRPSATDLTSYRALLTDAELGFEVFLTVIVTPDAATGWNHPRLTAWLITTRSVRLAALHARLPKEDATG